MSFIINNNINKANKNNFINTIFKDSLMDHLAFDGICGNKVFIFNVNLTSNIYNISKYWKCLSNEEKEQANKYYNQLLSDKYIMSHGILRHILSYYTKQFPQNIEFIHNDYGKPFLKNNDIYFNMSHSHDMVSYVISSNYMVGVDIEIHNENINVQSFADLVLTLAEVQYLSKLEPQEKLKLFFKLWTKKESLIKANGQGLSYPINTIEAISLPSGGNILLTNEKNKLSKEWYCYELVTPENYSGAIAIESKITEIVYLEMNNQHNVSNSKYELCSCNKNF